MTEIGGAEQFRQLSAHEQARYGEHAKKMTTHAMDHAIPIVIAPPVSLGGAINNGTGFVVQLGSGFLLLPPGTCWLNMKSAFRNAIG